MTTSQMTTSQTTTSEHTTSEHATDDYVEHMHVHVTTDQVLAALTDPDQILAWWTSFTSAERAGDEIRLFMNRSTAPLVLQVRRPSAHEVAWAVTSCDFLAVVRCRSEGGKYDRTAAAIEPRMAAGLQ